MDFDFIMGCILVVMFATLITGGIILHDTPKGDDVYINVLGNVTNKYDTSTTTFGVISNGKTSTIVPITNYDYYITTQYGNITIPAREYNLIEKGDTVVLKENVNKSDFNYVCKITEVR